MDSLPFEVRTGLVDTGWCDFYVRLGDQSWSCRASYIGEYPPAPLIRSAVDMHTRLFKSHWRGGKSFWDSKITAEPGGILIRVSPSGTMIKVTIFYSESDIFDSRNIDRPTADRPYIPPVAEGLVDYWDYADAIFVDAAKAIVRQGFVGLREAWNPGSWGADFDGYDPHFPMDPFPTDHFFYLAALKKYRSPKPKMSFEEELSLLQQLHEQYKS